MAVFSSGLGGHFLEWRIFLPAAGLVVQAAFLPAATARWSLNAVFLRLLHTKPLSMVALKLMNLT